MIRLVHRILLAAESKRLEFVVVVIIPGLSCALGLSISLTEGGSMIRGTRGGAVVGLLLRVARAQERKTYQSSSQEGPVRKIRKFVFLRVSKGPGQWTGHPQWKH